MATIAIWLVKMMLRPKTKADKLSLVVMGRPKGKGRHRLDPRTGRAYTPKETRAAEKMIHDLFAAKYPHHKPWNGAILIRWTAIFKLPKNATLAQKEAAKAGKLYYTGKPDKDNIEKLFCDALNALAWHDDGQVMGGGMKRYGYDTAPRVEITIEKLEAIQNPSDRRRAKKGAQKHLI